MTEGHTLSRRDSWALARLVTAPSRPDGFCAGTTRELRGDMPLTTWQRATASLASAGLVSCSPVSAGRFVETAYRVTESGRARAADQPGGSVGWSRVGDRVGGGLVLSLPLNSSPSQEKQSKEKKEEATERVGGLVSGLVAAIPPAVLVEFIKAATGALNRVAPQQKCECGRPEFLTTGKHGPYMRCQAKGNCPIAKDKKAKAAEKARNEGPRVSPSRSEQERQQRLEALAASKKVS